jgi:hypothetical protein
VEFFGSWASDYIKLKYLMMVQMTGALVLSISLIVLDAGGAVRGVILGHGMMQGVFGILSNVTWPRFYGRRHLGAIAGLATAITVAGTAIGPALFSSLRDLTGTYATAAAVTAGVATVLAGLATRAERPPAPAE